MSGRLENKVAIITGTAGGQGRAAALRFAEEGARVIGCDLDEVGNRETVRLADAADGEMRGMAPVDLGDPDQARRWVEDSAAVHGRIDIVYNNASAARFAPIGDHSIEDWRFTIRNELDLVFYVTRFAWPHLAVHGGVIINIASVAGLAGSRSAPMVAHAATKGGVIAMTRQLAVEGGPHGIRAVSISPGVIETPGTAALLADPAVRAAIVGHNIIPRAGTPRDVVDLAVYLASDEAAFVTGTNFVVDGGMTVT